MSKYYGESERLLGKVFSLANELPNGAIIFLDEVTEAFIAYTMTFYIFCNRLYYSLCHHSFILVLFFFMLSDLLYLMLMLQLFNFLLNILLLLLPVTD